MTLTSNNSDAIVISNLRKTFRIPHEKKNTFYFKNLTLDVLHMKARAESEINPDGTLISKLSIRTSSKYNLRSHPEEIATRCLPAHSGADIRWRFFA